MGNPLMNPELSRNKRNKASRKKNFQAENYNKHLSQSTIKKLQIENLRLIRKLKPKKKKEF